MFFYIKIGFFGKLSKINFNWIFFEIKPYSLYYNDLESFKEFLSDSHYSLNITKRIDGNQNFNNFEITIDKKESVNAI